jgi:mRNA interferase MazF
MRKGDVYLADLNPTRGSEQAGTRPVVIFQKDILNKFTRTVIVIPFTTNLSSAKAMEACVRIRLPSVIRSGCWIDRV